MTELTSQEVFDTTARHLLNQGRRAMVGQACTYRDLHGLKCAAGIWIPDDVYTEEMEGDSIVDIIKIYHLTRLDPHMGLLRELQQCHDSCTPSHWKQDLKHIANKRGLETKVLEEFP